MNHKPDPQPPDAFLRLSEVCNRTGRSRAGIYQAIAAGTFPQPRALGARSVGWLESEVTAWIKARPVSGNLGTFRPSGREVARQVEPAPAARPAGRRASRRVAA